MAVWLKLTLKMYSNWVEASVSIMYPIEYLVQKFVLIWSEFLIARKAKK